MDIREKNDLMHKLMTIKDITDTGKINSINFDNIEMDIISSMLDAAYNGVSNILITLDDYLKDLSNLQERLFVDKLRSKINDINSDINIVNKNNGTLEISW